MKYLMILCEGLARQFITYKIYYIKSKFLFNITITVEFFAAYMYNLKPYPLVDSHCSECYPLPKISLVVISHLFSYDY